MNKLNKHILIVDDEEINISLFGKMVRHLGYNVTATVDSLNALRLFSENPYQYDLILADHTMPNLTGAELCEKIKHLRPTMPVIIITGSANMDFSIFKKVGVNEIILKPVRIDSIKKSIEQYLA